MINVYPIKIEAVDDDGEVQFTMETFDAHAAMVNIRTVIGPDNIDDLVAAMRRAVVMLELK